MTTHITGDFVTASWDEKPYVEIAENHKLAKATVTTTYHGGIEGKGVLEYLLAYHGEVCDFVGYEHVTGTVDGRGGGFVLRHEGQYRAGGLTGTITVVPDSGTEELAGLTGSGEYRWRAEDKKCPFTFDYRSNVA